MYVCTLDSLFAILFFMSFFLYFDRFFMSVSWNRVIIMELVNSLEVVTYASVHLDIQVNYVVDWGKEEGQSQHGAESPKQLDILCHSTIIKRILVSAICDNI